MPPLDSHAPVNPVLKMALFVSGAVVLVAMTVGAVSYFVEAWQKITSVPNRGAYLVWLSFETCAAVCVCEGVVYTLIRRG